MKNPNQGLARIEVQSTLLTSGQYTDVKLTQFHPYQAGYHSAVISGSTFSSQTLSQKSGDASYNDFIYDQDGVRIGLQMRTIHINQQPRPMSMTSDIVREGSQLSGKIVNVGDGLILIVDAKSGQIKSLVPPTEYRSQIQQQWQTIDPDSKMEQIVELKSLQEDDLIIHITPGVWGEYVFRWQESKDRLSRTAEIADLQNIINQALATKESKGLVSIPDRKLMKTELEEGRDEEAKGTQSVRENQRQQTREKHQPSLSLSAQQIAHHILDQAIANSISKRKSFIEFIQFLQPAIADLNKMRFRREAEKQKYSITAWLRDLTSNGKRDFAIKISEFLYELEASQGIIFDRQQCSAFTLIENLQNRTFGDTGSISVMRVPNYKLELLRALVLDISQCKTLVPRIFVEFKSIDEILTVLQRLEREEKPLHQIVVTEEKRATLSAAAISQLSIEKYQQVFLLILQADSLHSFLRQQQPDPDNERKEVEEAKIKKACQQKLIDSLTKNKKLSIKEIAALYNAYKDNPLFNTHRNQRFDRFFGIKNTSTWRHTMQIIRNHAKTKLFAEVGQLQNTQEKKALLEWAKTQPLFCDHRNNFLFTGAWGRTQAIREIIAKQDSLPAEAKANGPVVVTPNSLH